MISSESQRLLPLHNLCQNSFQKSNTKLQNTHPLKNQMFASQYVESNDLHSKNARKGHQITASKQRNNNLRKSSENCLINKILQKKGDSNYNREKIMAYSYGSKYANLFVHHFKMLQKKQNYDFRKQKNQNQSKMKNIENRKQEERRLIITPRQLQKVNILKIRKKMKVSENIFNVKSISIQSQDHQELKKRYQNRKQNYKSEFLQTTNFHQLPKCDPLIRIVHKIKKSKHNITTQSFHSCNKIDKDNENQLKCQSINVIQIKKQMISSQSSKVRNQPKKVSKIVPRKQKVNLFSTQIRRLTEGPSSTTQVKNKKIIEKIRNYQKYIEQLRSLLNITWKITETSDKMCLRAYVGNGNNSRLLKQLIKKRWWWNLTKQKTSATFIWSQLRCKNFASQNFFHNHLQKNEQIGNKKSLFLHIKQYCQKTGSDPFNILPVTYNVKSLQDPQYQKSLEYFRNNMSQDPKKNLFIIKPGQNSNRGNGISVVPFDKLQSSVQQFFTLNKQSKMTKRNSKKTLIIQKYLNNPLLYHKRKFDIRCFVLISRLGCETKQFNCYWAKQGYIRTSGYEYDANDFQNQYIHLTNDAIQSRSQNYGKYQEANKVSFETFGEFIRSRSKETINFQLDILPKLKDITQKSLKACLSPIILSNHKLSPAFELLGLDFMIDQSFKPYLIQVNTNPCLQTSCRILQKVIPKLVDDALKLTLDIMFPPPPFQNWHQNKYYQALDVPNSFEKFQSLFLQESSIQQSKQQQVTELKNIFKKQQVEILAIQALEQQSINKL